MGTVYLGERIELFTQSVAIKILRPQFSVGSEEIAIGHEAQILTSLDHPGIVRLLDKGEYGPGLSYIVMEYIEGTPVEEFCDLRCLPVENRIRLLIQIMNAVDYAHRRLVIHSDLKPANILVTHDGQPKVMDFGIAMMLDPHRPHPSTGSSIPTLYTPAFASPEQLIGGRITSASDIYSLGVIASILLAGTAPSSAVFADSNYVQTAGAPASPLQALKRLDENAQQSIAKFRATSPAGLISVLRGDLDSILLKALRPEPEERYLTVQEFASDLTGFLEKRPVRAHRGSHIYTARKWMQRHRIVAAVSAFLLFIASVSVAGVVIQTARAAQQRRNAQTRLYDLVKLTDVLEGELFDSLSPLAHAEDARNSLIVGATTALDTLAARDGDDPALALEMARQYEKLARLQGKGTNHAANASLDLAKGAALLQKIPSSNRYYGAAQKLMADMHALQTR